MSDTVRSEKRPAEASSSKSIKMSEKIKIIKVCAKLQTRYDLTAVLYGLQCGLRLTMVSATGSSSCSEGLAGTNS